MENISTPQDVSAPLQTKQNINNHNKERKVLLIIIIVCALAGITYILYTRYVKPKNDAENKASMIQYLSDNSPIVPDEIKQPMVDSLAKSSAKAQVTEDQKAGMLDALSQ